MECREFEKRIHDFIDKKLDYVTLREFAGHMKKCSACMEELTIQFLIQEGLVRLEKGSAFDLNRELQMRISEAEKKIRRNNLVISIGALLEYIVMLAVAVIIFYIIFGW